MVGKQKGRKAGRQEDAGRYELRRGGRIFL